MVNILIRLLLVIMLSGCAAQQAYQNGRHLYDAGQVEEGLAEVEKAYKLDPDNSEYRSQYFRLRDRVVFKWLSQADAAKKDFAWEDAGNYYKNILKIDPDNTRAKIGLNSLNTEKEQSLLLAEANTRLAGNDLLGAAKNVRQVLAESPSQTEALKLKKLIEAKESLRNQSDAIFKSKLERPITIEFKDSPIKTIFDFISKASGTNFIFDKEVRSDLRASILVRDARIEDAIRFLLLSNQLEQRILNGNTLYIYPSTPQKLKDFQEMKVKDFYLANASAKEVAAMLKGIVKTKDIYVDEKANLIVMRDSPDVIRVAERLVAAQDIAEPETVLEVEVLEVGTSLLETIGIQYPNQLSFSVVGAANTAGTVTLPELLNRNAGLVNATISNPAMVINMLHQDGDTNLLANPKIRVKNHEKAHIHIGEKVPVITNTSTSTGVVSQSVNYLDVGLKLEVEPTIYLENDVGIKVGLEVSNITNTIQNTNGSLTYQLGTRSASTVLRLRDGETQMLAGLISREDRKTRNGIPGLGQLPIFGRLFSSGNDNSSKTEVVLLITPHVVRNIVRPEAPVEEFSSGTESAISIDRMELNTVESDKRETSTPKSSLPASSTDIKKPPFASMVAPAVVPMNSLISATSITPGSIQPGSIQPGSVQPGSIQPGSIQPGSIQPGSIQPGSIQPGSIQPGSIQPGSIQPGSIQPGSIQPGSIQPGSVQPGSAQPGSAQPGSAQPGSALLSLDSPTQVSVEKDFTVKVNLFGNGVQNAFLDISFNPAQLKVVSVIEGDVTKNANGKIKFMQQVQDKVGRINLGLTGHENMQNRGMIASIIFQPLISASGKTELRVGAANLSGEAGHVLPTNVLPSVTLEVVK